MEKNHCIQAQVHSVLKQPGRWREEGGARPPSSSTKRSPWAKCNLLPMKESLHFPVLRLIENTLLLLLFATLKIMLAYIASHLDFQKEIVFFILFLDCSSTYPTHTCKMGQDQSTH